MPTSAQLKYEIYPGNFESKLTQLKSKVGVIGGVSLSWLII